MRGKKKVPRYNPVQYAALKSRNGYKISNAERLLLLERDRS